MEYFKLRDGNKLPVIALGPGAVVRKEVLPYAHLSSNPIVKIGQKVVNKLIYEKESLVFINNVARGINLGFELIDNSAAYGSSQLVRYNPQIQISAESETKRSIFREKDKTKRSKKESAQHSKSRNKSFVMTSVSAL